MQSVLLPLSQTGAVRLLPPIRQYEGCIYYLLFVYLFISVYFFYSQLNEPESAANTMRRSVSSFLGQVSSVLNPTPDDEDEEAIVIHDSQPVVLTKFQVMHIQ